MKHFDYLTIIRKEVVKSRHFKWLVIALLFVASISVNGKTIHVAPPDKGYCNAIISRALEEAAREKGRPAIIQLQLGRYIFGRDESIHRRYLISNTASEKEDADQIKHECGEPVIHVAPENKIHEGAVHRNISVMDNHFLLKGKTAVKARSTDEIMVTGNLIGMPDTSSQEDIVILDQCENVKIEKNCIHQRSTRL